MTKYQTREGDVLEKIAFKQYGRSSAALDILEANRAIGLSDYPAKLPAGLVIELPDLSPPEKKTVNLWN